MSLDPANVGYRINVANVLLAMGQGQNAVRVLETAAKLAKSPQESQALDNLLMNAQEYAASQEQNADQNRRIHETANSAPERASTVLDASHPADRKEFVASGPHRFAVGVLRNVKCDNPNLDLAVTSSAKTLTLHSDDYYKIQFTTLGFQPSGDLNPCRDLENRAAKVEYVESADKTVPPHLIGIELHN